MSTPKKPKLLDEVKRVMRLLLYSIHTERAYYDWSKRYVPYHQIVRRDDLMDDEVQKGV